MISDVVPTAVAPLAVGPLVAGTGARKTHYRTQEMVNWVKMINTEGKTWTIRKYICLNIPLLLMETTYSLNENSSIFE